MYSGPRLESNHPPSSSFAPCKRRACYQPNNSHLFFMTLAMIQVHTGISENMLYGEKKKRKFAGEIQRPAIKKRRKEG